MGVSLLYHNIGGSILCGLIILLDLCPYGRGKETQKQTQGEDDVRNTETETQRQTQGEDDVRNTEKRDTETDTCRGKTMGETT